MRWNQDWLIDLMFMLQLGEIITAKNRAERQRMK